MPFDSYQSFAQPSSLCICQPCTLNQVQCPADTDVLKVTWFRKVLTSCLNLNAADASQLQRTCKAIVIACLQLILIRYSYCALCTNYLHF